MTHTVGELHNGICEAHRSVVGSGRGLGSASGNGALGGIYYRVQIKLIRSKKSTTS